MRAILFRGKDKYTDQWRYGFLTSPDVIGIIHDEKDGMETGDLYDVYSETIGQFIGLITKDGKKVFEHDIIEFSDSEGRIHKKEVNWNNNLLCIMIGNMPYEKLFNSAYIQPSVLGCKIIGNIHDNPELLKEE